jgi:tRNA-2-methylthio-N6-dimethylallyladenosine synthase
MVTVTITRAAPHYLVADGRPAAVRSTRAGDAWAVRLTGASPAGPAPVALGMPALSRPV